MGQHKFSLTLISLTRVDLFCYFLGAFLDVGGKRRAIIDRLSHTFYENYNNDSMTVSMFG